MEKYDAILILTNQCNLKCAYCIYACDITTTKYYITLEEIDYTLHLMKQKLSSLKRVILSGGDPFMHPDFIKICEKIREIFPTIELCAYTNGLLLEKFSNNDLVYLVKNLKLNILSSLYPSLKNLQIYKTQEKRFNKLNIPLYYQSSHFYFNKQNYKISNSKKSFKEIFSNFQNCRTLTNYNQLITIYKNKILVCCGEVGYLNNNKSSNLEDLLDLQTLKNEQQIFDFCKYPHKICYDCITNKQLESFILWQEKNEITQKHQENDLGEIFSNNYNDYKKLFLQATNHLICLKDQFFYNKFLDEVNPGELNYLNIKYLNGIADVYVPYNESFKSDLYELLIKKLSLIKDVEKYNFYFVGINNSIHQNQIIFNTHKKLLLDKSFSTKIKITFLQGTDFVDGYKEFLKYSYLKKKIILNINNFLITNNNTLENEEEKNN